MRHSEAFLPPNWSDVLLIFFISACAEDVRLEIANDILSLLIPEVVIECDFSQSILEREISLVESNLEAAIINYYMPIWIDFLVSYYLAL